MPKQIPYRNIFNIKLKHAYYKREVPRDLALVPFRGTSTLLRSLGIRIKQTQGTLAFFAAQHSAEQLKNIKDKRFSFQLDNSNPIFINFTDIPVSYNPYKNQDILFFHNATRSEQLHSQNVVGADDFATFGGNRLSLVVGEEKTNERDNTIYVPKKPSESFTVDVIDGLTKQVLWTEQFQRSPDANGEDERVFTVDKKVISRESLQKGSTNFTINLEQLTEGKYTINVDGNEATTLCVLHDTMRPPLGMVNIFVKDLLEHMEASKPEGPTYEISFANRNTYWRYRLNASK